MDISLEKLESNKKQIGKCPFCEEMVQAVIVEGNTLRRDQCKCPNPKCEQPILLCRSPGCHDYAKSTSVYDHEFCPECTSTVSKVGAEVGSAALKVAGLVATAVITGAINGKKK